jgi:hypothetical protein
MPVTESMVAWMAGLAYQVPPLTELVSAIVAPAQTCEGPPIAEGVALTVIILVAAQLPTV